MRVSATFLALSPVQRRPKGRGGDWTRLEQGLQSRGMAERHDPLQNDSGYQTVHGGLHCYTVVILKWRYTVDILHMFILA